MIYNHFTKSIFILPVLLVIFVVMGCTHKHEYIDGDINDIVYTQPTEEARNFDIKGYIDTLKPLEYEKKEYPAEQTYTHTFNKDYVLTIDIPQEYYVCEEKFNPTGMVEKTKGFKDSCTYAGELSCCADEEKCIIWRSTDIKVISDNYFIISKTPCNTFSSQRGLMLYPYKSAYTGISLRDTYVKGLKSIDDLESKNGKKEVFARKFVVDNVYFRVISTFQSDVSPSFSTLLDDNQAFYVSRSVQFTRDEVVNILDSIRIEKKN